mmetsp:Transcript_8332/g.21495  ORF Transcript_8332/g.21495 Transcript_8332/m.21495 type:complete len:254 (-) Transcript_8332:1181-1942(-)
MHSSHRTLPASSEVSKKRGDCEGKKAEDQSRVDHFTRLLSTAASPSSIKIKKIAGHRSWAARLSLNSPICATMNIPQLNACAQRRKWHHDDVMFARSLKSICTEGVDYHTSATDTSGVSSNDALFGEFPECHLTENRIFSDLTGKLVMDPPHRFHRAWSEPQARFSGSRGREADLKERDVHSTDAASLRAMSAAAGVGASLQCGPSWGFHRNVVSRDLYASVCHASPNYLFRILNYALCWSVCLEHCLATGGK